MKKKIRNVKVKLYAYVSKSTYDQTQIFSSSDNLKNVYSTSSNYMVFLPGVILKYIIQDKAIIMYTLICELTFERQSFCLCTLPFERRTAPHKKKLIHTSAASFDVVLPCLN